VTETKPKRGAGPYVDVGDGSSTTADLLVDLRTHLTKASPQHRRRIRNLIVYFESDEDRGRGRPPVQNDAAALASIRASVAGGMKLSVAVFFAARQLRKNDRSATLHSVKQRLYRKFRENSRA
jgi:hypothetical protein